MAKPNNTRLEKVPEELLKNINNAMRIRISNGLEPVGRRYQNYIRYLRAINRHKQLWEDIHKLEFKDDS